MQVPLAPLVEASNRDGKIPFSIHNIPADVTFTTKQDKNKEDVYGRKIRLYPTKEQKAIFRKMFGVSRCYYNDAIALYNKESKRNSRIMNKLAKDGCIFQNTNEEQCKKELHNSKFFCKKHKTFKITGGTPRTFISYKKVLIKSEEPAWKGILPYDSKVGVIRNAIASIESARSNLRNGNIEGFQMGFRSRKDTTQVIYFDSGALKPGLKLCQKLFKKEGVPSILKIKSKKDIAWIENQFEIGIEKTEERAKSKRKPGKVRTAPYRQKLVSDFIIKFEYPNKYFLCIPSIRDSIIEDAPYNVVALDPGTRTFQTYYSSDSVKGKFGDGTEKRLIKIGKKVDKISSAMSKEPRGRRKRRMRKRCFRLRNKAKNIVTELHNQTARFLCQNFENILLPEFKTGEMIQKETRRINSTTVRGMVGLCHYKFYIKLQSMAEHYNRNLFRCNEAYTTATCTSCGRINDVGGSKVYKCECGYEEDRDIHGARNVLYRHLSYIAGSATAP